MLNHLPNLQYVDVLVVKYACENLNINVKKVSHANKERLSGYTGLSTHAIKQALTNIRKYK